MDLQHLIDRVNSKESFLEFLEALEKDWDKDQELSKGAPDAPFAVSPLGWENGTVGAFLEAMRAWAIDTNTLGEEPSWKAFAEILRAGKMYE
ncbi:MAG: hypothetical protein ACJ741_10030 [Pyrinomonadaceae bacterium]